MTKLRQVEQLIKFYFAPWGAAKGEVMEDIFDTDLTDSVMIAYIESLINNTFSFSEQQLKYMKIVAP